MEYVSGDPVLIKNIVTQLKSQGIFDQFRKECIADVDTKPAYQNLCHLADTQVSKFLSKVKWGPDSHKNQIRENLRRQLNECHFVEPGIAIIVDQLVNPRINTVLVPKVEDMLYKYLGIPRETQSDTSRKEYKSFSDRKSTKDVSDSSARSSTQESFERKRDHEKPSPYSSTDGAKTHEISKTDSKTAVKSDTVTNKTQVPGDKSYRDVRSNIKSEPGDVTSKDFGEPGKSGEIEKREMKLEEKEEPVQSMLDSESSDDEMSPPYEPNEKSENDMSIDSGSSNYSEIIDPKTIEADIPIETEIENICKTEDSKIITEHEDSMDSVRSHYSPPPVPEKIIISPLEIPKTPTINYETSEDSDDNLKNKKIDNDIPVAACIEPLDIPEVNFDKIVENVIEDNVQDIKPPEKIDVAFESKPLKEEEGSQKPKEKSRDDDAKKKQKHKDDRNKLPDSKEKSTEKKPDHKSDKDRSRDKHKSEHRSKDRDKDRSKHDSKSHRKDDKSHRGKDRDHKSDHDKKAKSDHRKDDKSEHKKDDKIEPKKDDKGERKKDEKSEHKKDEKSEHRKDNRKHDDQKKHSRDDKESKKDPRKSTSDDKRSKSKSDDSKYKHDKPKDDKKPKDGDHSHKSKKKDDDVKKSRSHCNVDEKKKTDRRSSDRDSSGPSASNASHTSTHHSSKTDKDKGSSRHRHSSSSSSHKTKKNDIERGKDGGKPPQTALKLQSDKNLVADKMPEDDLELILESSPEKAFNRDMKSEVDFTKKILKAETSMADAEKGSDHIEDMMNELFQPKALKSNEVAPEASVTCVASAAETIKSDSNCKVDSEVQLKKPKIAKNFADIRRIMKLRKLYKESSKTKEEQGKENADVEPTADESPNENSSPNQMKLRKTVDYFVTRRFGKNGSNVEKCKELTNAIMETLTGVKLNITRVDRRYPIVDGTCRLDEKNLIDSVTDVENLQIIHDEQANLVLEDLAKDFKVENSSPLQDEIIDDLPDEAAKVDSQSSDKALKIINSCTSEVKANGAKTRLPAQIKQKFAIEPAEVNLQMQLNIVDSLKSTNLQEKTDETDDVTSPSLKLKFKSTYDGRNKTWHACDNANDVEDAVYYFSSPTRDNEFRKFVAEFSENLDIEVDNLVVEMEYPECYDHIFISQLGAKVVRKRIADDPSNISPIKYNSEIISKKMGDKSIMLRIKKTPEIHDDPESANVKSKKRKTDTAAEESDVLEITTTNDNLDSSNVTPCANKKAPVKRKSEVKRKTLGIKRSLVSSVTNSLKLKLTATEITTDADQPAEHNESPITDKPKSTSKKLTNVARKAKESAVADASHKRSESESSDGRRSSVSSTGNTHSKTNEGTPVPAKNKKNFTSESPNDITPKAVDQPKKPNDAKSVEEKRKQTIMNCYYDQSDLYKPRPSVRLTSRRYQLNNAENT